MFRLTSAFVVAALFTAFAVDRPAHGEDANVVAMNTNRTVMPTESTARTLTLDDYAGVYRTADGATFVVVRNGDALSIEMPETIALPIVAAGPSFVLDSSFARIAFETDQGIVRMLLMRSVGEPVVATRVQLPRGLVTLQDI